MVELRRLTINDNHYYYLFHAFRENNQYRKFKKYLGAQEPSHEEYLKSEKEFLEETQKLINNPSAAAAKEKSNIISILQHIMEQEGYISEENFVKLSKDFDVPLTQLIDVATFYSQFKFSKPGKYTISMCDGTACHVKKSTEIIKHVQELLDIKPGKVTKDGKFGFDCVNCIGACARAPSMMINGVVYGKLDKKKVDEIIKSLP